METRAEEVFNGGRNRHSLADGAGGDQLERMKAVRIFNPLHVLGNKISESDIDGLKIIKFNDHPEIGAEIEVMKKQGEGHIRLI